MAGNSTKTVKVKRDGKVHTCKTIMAAVRDISHRAANDRLANLKAGKITVAEAYRPLGTRKDGVAGVCDDDMAKPEYDPNDRSPGWWERKHLNPTGFYDVGERCVL